MKKVAAAICILAAGLVTIASAGMRERAFEVDVTGDTGAASTNTATYTIRGPIKQFYIDQSAGATTDVTIATARVNLFALDDFVGDTNYYPRIQICDRSGVLATNANGSPVWGDLPVASAVTVTAIGKAAGVSNDLTVYVMYDE